MTDPTHNNPTEGEQIDAALALLSQEPLPTTTLPDPAPSPHQAAGESPKPLSSGSPTLAALGKSRRPSPEVVCGTCPNSVWFASPKEVKCYCRVMFLVTWSNQEPNPITHCDGALLGQE